MKKINCGGSAVYCENGNVRRAVGVLSKVLKRGESVYAQVSMTAREARLTVRKALKKAAIDGADYCAEFMTTREKKVVGIRMIYTGEAA